VSIIEDFTSLKFSYLYPFEKELLEPHPNLQGGVETWYFPILFKKCLHIETWTDGPLALPKRAMW